MASRDPAEPNRDAQSLDDELIGLDREDPETQAFAAHLSRMQREGPSYTVEGYLDGVSDFADSANRVGGGRRLVAVLLVASLLAVAAYLIADAAGFVFSTWF
jgi:hypothetical protein